MLIKKISKVFVTFAVSGVLLVTFGWKIFQMNHRAVLSGNLKFNTVSDEVIIRRDSFGVPHIQANNDEDVFWAQGFVHAQDRLAQMEFNRRFAQGRLSQVLGPKVLGVDKQMRILGLYPAAKKSTELLSESSRKKLQAYADGVNEVIASGRYSLPLNLLVSKVEPWAVEDSLVMGKLIGFALGNKEWRLKLGSGFWDDDQWDKWYPTLQQNSTVSSQEGRRQGLPMLHKALVKNYAKHKKINTISTDLDLSKLWESGASNAVVVGPKRSANKSSLMMADPHLSPSFPDTWYTADMEFSEHRISGASLPGAPGVVFGRNKHVAWSFTYSFVDQSELVSNPRNIRKVHHIIEVKGEDPVKFISEQSDDGPIIAYIDDQPVALNWEVDSDDDTGSEALLGMNFASSIKESFQSMSKFIAPALNLLAIDDKGHVGYHLSGRIPKRKTIQHQVSDESNRAGNLEWQYMPHAIDPLSGYLINANNSPISNKYRYDLSAIGYELRASRMLEMLPGKARWTSDMLKALQLDVKELEWAMIKPALSKINGSHANKEVWDWFSQWDGECQLDAKYPSLYQAWLTQITNVAYDASWRRGFPALYDFRIQRIVSLLQNEKECQGLGYHSCGHLLDVTLTQAMNSLAGGMDYKNIPAWKEVHRVEFKHPIFSKIPFMGKDYHIKVSVPGGRATLNRAQWSTFQKDNSVLSISSYRMIVDMGKRGYHFEYIQPLSETENPYQPYAFRFLDSWVNGNYLSIDQPIQYELTIKPSAR
ncbi:MAG TPA: penicillin acylase family protein [Gammaproteobacteria bacterium]|nr:penicillin acylase family protein [Gammaproteobacteria bacterium]